MRGDRVLRMQVLQLARGGRARLAGRGYVRLDAEPADSGDAGACSIDIPFLTDASTMFISDYPAANGP